MSRDIKQFFSKIKEIVTLILILGFLFYTAFQAERVFKSYLNSTRQYKSMRDSLMVARVERILRYRKYQYLTSAEGKKQLLLKSGFAPAGSKIYKIKGTAKNANFGFQK